MFETKGLLLILDGLGDRPVGQLGGKTPLEAADTPVMDRLAATGLCGLVYHIAPGIPVGTQTGSGLLLGLAPADIGKLSRGLVQAVGAGIALQPNDIAIRCNFATLERANESFKILDRRAGRISSDTEQLAEALNACSVIDEVRFFARASTQHRVSLVLRGEGLSEAISNTDPGSGRKKHGLLKSTALNPGDHAAVRTAALLNAFLEKSHATLKDHPVNKMREARGLLPANGLITRGAGRMEALNNMLHLLKIKTAVISGEGTLHGLGHLFKFDVFLNPKFTATVDTDLQGKVATAIQALEDHDLVILHVKGPDVCSHDCDPIGKKEFIEVLDEALIPLATMDLVFGITADHSTDSNTGRHTGDPVPSLISSQRGRKDVVHSFSESSCSNGGFGQISATSFLCSLLDQMNRMHNFRSNEFDYFR